MSIKEVTNQKKIKAYEEITKLLIANLDKVTRLIIVMEETIWTIKFHLKYDKDIYLTHEISSILDKYNINAEMMTSKQLIPTRLNEGIWQTEQIGLTHCEILFK